MNIKKKIELLKNKPQPEQRTEEWYFERNTKITASEVSSLLYKIPEVCNLYLETYNISPDTFKFKNTETLSPFDTKDDYIIKKCNNFFGEKSVYRDTPHTLWGKKYEDVVARFYSLHTQEHINPFGLLTHSRLKWLGASPDGITDNGIMLEIKCPKSRKVTGVPPIYYWIQMQIQLEVANLDLCDYVECEISELTQEEFLSIETDIKQLGVVLETNLGEYIYPTSQSSKEEYLSWISENPDCTPSFYNIHKWFITRVHRNKEWFSIIKPILQTEWKNIKHLQNNFNIFQEYKEKIELIKHHKYHETFNNTECIIEDTNSTMEF